MNQRIKRFNVFWFYWLFDIFQSKKSEGGDSQIYIWSFKMNQRIKRINVFDFFYSIFFSFQKFRGGSHRYTWMQTALEINQKIKRINIFHLFDYLILFIQKILRGGGTHNPDSIFLISINYLIFFILKFLELTDTNMNINSFKINQRIKRIHFFYFSFFSFKKFQRGDSQIHT